MLRKVRCGLHPGIGSPSSPGHSMTNGEEKGVELSSSSEAELPVPATPCGVARRTWDSTRALMLFCIFPQAMVRLKVAPMLTSCLVQSAASLASLSWCEEGMVVMSSGWRKMATKLGPRTI